MKEFVIGIVFNHDSSELLLMRRKKDPYNGLINGIGGKVDQGESVSSAMDREFNEETGYTTKDILHKEFMMTISFPSEILHAYYIKLKEPKEIIVTENHEGTYHWTPISKSLLDCNNTDLAGEGSLSYFIKFAMDIHEKGEI